MGGAHLSAAHGLTAETYRERYGLMLRRALEAPERRVQRSASTRARVEREPRPREMLERGAAAGLSAATAAANHTGGSDTPEFNAAAIWFRFVPYCRTAVPAVGNHLLR